MYIRIRLTGYVENNRLLKFKNKCSVKWLQSTALHATLTKIKMIVWYWRVYPKQLSKSKGNSTL